MKINAKWKDRFKAAEMKQFHAAEEIEMYGKMSMFKLLLIVDIFIKCGTEIRIIAFLLF